MWSSSSCMRFRSDTVTRTIKTTYNSNTPAGECYILNFVLVKEYFFFGVSDIYRRQQTS